MSLTQVLHAEGADVATVLLSCDRVLSVPEEEHFTQVLYAGVFDENGQQDTVESHLVGGLSAEGTDPPRIGCLRHHVDIAVQVKTLVVPTIDAPHWQLDAL